MGTRLIVYLLIAGICGALNYFVTLDFLFSILIGLVGFGVGVGLIERKIITYFNKENRTKECIIFINNFVITLSINKSVLETFEICQKTFSKKLKNQVKLLENLTVQEKIHYLGKYFDSSLYEIFLKLLDQYEYNGGDILKISQILLFDAHQIEEDINNHDSILVKKLMEFITMWVITFVVLVLMKVSLGDYFDKIITLDFFKYGLMAFFGFFYINVTALVYHGFNLNFVEDGKEDLSKPKKVKKGGNKHEKVKRANATSK